MIRWYFTLNDKMIFDQKCFIINDKMISDKKCNIWSSKKQAQWLNSEYWLISSAIIGIRSSKQRKCALCLNDKGSRHIGPWENVWPNFPLSYVESWGPENVGGKLTGMTSGAQFAQNHDQYHQFRICLLNICSLVPESRLQICWVNKKVAPSWGEKWSKSLGRG